MRVYHGPERRRHRIYRTHNTEYHCRDDVCIAVRDLRTGQFREEHPAIGRRMTGGIRFTRDGSVASYSRRGESPHLGENLYFTNGEADVSLRTSALERIERPPKEVVEHYRG